jgi:hypothetical protein
VNVLRTLTVDYMITLNVERVKFSKSLDFQESCLERSLLPSRETVKMTETFNFERI